MPQKGARKPSQKPSWQRDLVRERIDRLFSKAGDSFRDNPERSRRYVEMALRLSMRYNVRMPPSLKRRFCSSCHSLLVPGKSSTVRASPSQKAVVQTCKECGHVARHPYRKERSRKEKPSKKPSSIQGPSRKGRSGPGARKSRHSSKPRSRAGAGK